MRMWDAPGFYRPIAAPLDRCAELLGVDLATAREMAANVEPYIRADGTKIWSLMQLERQLRPRASAFSRYGAYVRIVADDPAVPDQYRSSVHRCAAAWFEPDES